MKLSRSLKPAICLTSLIVLLTDTVRASIYVSSFIPSNPIRAGQSMTLEIDVAYDSGENPNGWNGTVNWGDGSSTSVGAVYSPSYWNHTYTNAGSYNISFSGTGYEYDYNGFFGSRRDFNNALSASTSIAAQPAPPSFTLQPTNQIVFPGSNAVFAAAMPGNTAPVLCQWFKGGTAIAGATNQTLAITNVQVAGEGNYSLFATNVSGTNWSSAAVLVVRRPLKILFGGFTVTNTYRLTAVDADSSAIDPLRISTMSIQTKTNLDANTSWQAVTANMTLNTGVLTFEATNSQNKQAFFRAVETP